MRERGGFLTDPDEIALLNGMRRLSPETGGVPEAVA